MSLVRLDRDVRAEDMKQDMAAYTYILHVEQAVRDFSGKIFY